MKVSVIGSGSWGTALAQLVAANGNDVCMWARRDDVVRGINQEKRNPRYLSEHVLSDRIAATQSYVECVADAQMVIVATPSTVMREVARELSGCVGALTPVVICSKGAEAQTGCLPAEVFEQEMGNPARIAVLSGPNHAEEVVAGVPSGTVVACANLDTAQFVQDVVTSDTFRAYASEDCVGVELCAASKNVVAIAVGISCALGYGDNTTAMLMTRGLAEMSRLVHAMGGQAITCMGLAGMGDLIATCMSRHSRNRRFGEMVAGGGTLEQFQEQTHMVAEGAHACRTLLPLAERCGVELPITTVVRSVVWEGADPKQAASALSHRVPTEEFYGLGQA